MPSQSSKSLGKDGLKPWLSHAQPEFQEPGEGRAAVLTVSCPARVSREWGRTGCSADCLMPSQSSKSLGKDGLHQSLKSLGKDGLKPWLSHAQPEFKEPGEGRAEALAIPCPARVQGAGEGRAAVLTVSCPARSSKSLGKDELKPWLSHAQLEFQEQGEGRAASSKNLGKDGLKPWLSYAQPEFRSLWKDGRAKVLAIPCPARVPRAWGRTGGLMRWLSHAQPEFKEPGEPEFQEPGEGRAAVLTVSCPARVPRAWGRTGCSADCLMPSQSSRSLGKDGPKPWLSHAQPEFKEPGEGRAESLTQLIYGQSSRSLGKDGLKPWLSHAQPEFQEPGEGRAEALAIPCPARVQGAWGRTG
uniref:Uncharacterized protein n=1 Tax=Xenopus tropicalis TaxID=8364 RepID=A0A1B8XT26_XENTR